MSQSSPRKRRKRRRGEVVNINTSQLRFEEQDGLLVASIDGDFDILSLPEIEPGLSEAAEEVDVILLNLLEVDYIDAAAIALLERINKNIDQLLLICSTQHQLILERFALACYQDVDQAGAQASS